MAEHQNGKRHALAAKIATGAKARTQIEHSKAWSDIDLELRGMTMGARSTLLTECYTQDANRRPIFAKFYPQLLRGGCFDPTDGSPVFEGESDEFILSLAAEEVERIAGILLTLSGLNPEAEKTLGGDSGGTTTSTSATSSRATSSARSKN